MTSRILGLAREQVLAYWFGAGDAMDALLVAFRVPNLVRDLFAEGAMSAALVPTFSKSLATDGRPSAWRLGNNVINTLLLVTGVLALLGMAFAEPVVRALADGFAAVPGKIELTVLLTRILLPFLILVAVAAACMGMLNSLNVFFIPALSPAMFNVASIVVAVAFVPVAIRAGIEPVITVAVGALVGGFAQVLLQWPSLRAQGFRYRPTLDLRDPGLHRVLMLMGPGTIGLAATQVNVFVNTMVATGEGTGAVSWLGYAFRVMYLPIGLFGVSIATATTPAMSRSSGGGRPRADAQDVGVRRVPDAHLERAGDVGTRRARNTDRASAVRTRAVHASRHGGHGRGGATVRRRPRRIFGGEDPVADLLCPRTEPHAGRGRRGRGAPQRRAQRGERAGLRLSRSGAQRVDRSARQRRDPGVAASTRARRIGAQARGQHVRQDRRGGRMHGRAARGRRSPYSRACFRVRDSSLRRLDWLVPSR